MKEIGSEFWKIDNNNLAIRNDLSFFKNMGKDIKYLMSGRTAIDYVLNNINDTKKIVYMPEYCCSSMIQPFIDKGYYIEYYKIDLINNKYFINEDQDCSVFFGMSYFGYNISNMDKYIKIFKDKNIIVLEDITHRILCKENYCASSDYLIASLRKWFPIYTGGIAINRNNFFNKNVDEYDVNRSLIEYKRKAMELKRRYILGKSNAKNEFLELFKKSNELVVEYKNKKMDRDSIEILKRIDIQEIIGIRKKNVQVIERKIMNVDGVDLIYKFREGDCPLFVPVLLKNRDKLREKLISNNIYCPIHWPKCNDSVNEIYENEISLICDQRYNEKDIENYINKFLNILGEV